MPSAQEIVNSLYGAWRLLRGDANAMTFFNHSIEGFWRSFFAVVLVAPMLLLIVLMNQAAVPAEDVAEDPGGTANVFVQLAGFAFAWAAYPIAMVWISRMLQLGHRYVGYIIAWNWSNVVGAVIMLLVRLIVATEILPTGVAGALSVFAFGYVLFYAYLVTKIGLACATGTAIALVIFEVLLEPVIDLSIGGLLRAAL